MPISVEMLKAANIQCNQIGWRMRRAVWRAQRRERSPITGSKGPETVPDAWRDQSRGAEGQPQRMKARGAICRGRGAVLEGNRETSG